MKKVARLRIPQDEQQFLPPGGKIGGNAEQTLVRTTGRIKKPKAVFDPSDNYVPRSQRNLNLQTSPANSPKASISSVPRERSLSTSSNTSNCSISQEDICIVCLKREPRRGGNYRNKLIPCVDCNKRVHRMCMSVDYYEAAPLRQNYRCENCRICEVCSAHESDTKPNNELITCAKCCKSFHITCHTPKVAKFQQSQRHWKCSKCNPNTTVTASLQTGNINNNNNNNKKETVIPVKIIRQIIGDESNLPSVLQTQQSSQTSLQQLPQAVKAQKQQQQPQQQKQQDEQHQQEEEEQNVSIKSEPTEDQKCVNIAEAAAEASAKAAALRVKRTEPVHKTASNGGYGSEESEGEDNENDNEDDEDNDNDIDDDEDDEDDDEDFEYVEKKKRKLTKPSVDEKKIEVSENIAETEPVKKTILNTNTNDQTINDLPKRETVKCWSVDRVASYVAKYFPNEAQVFIDHEIDGNALLLLKRSDVIQKLPLKLGPSLRLYNLILKIQTQTANDPTLGWDCSVDTLLPNNE